jgi:preprotein translocase subunit SecY
MVIIGVGLLIMSGILERTMWNIFLNPFAIPNRLNEMVWQETTMKNRIFLAVGTLLFVLYGLFNLQKREKFI